MFTENQVSADQINKNVGIHWYAFAAWQQIHNRHQPVIDNQLKGPFKMHKKFLSALNLNGYNLISSNTTGEQMEMCTGAIDTHGAWICTLALSPYIFIYIYLFIKCVYMNCTHEAITI